MPVAACGAPVGTVVPGTRGPLTGGQDGAMSPDDIADRFRFHPADTAEKRAAHEHVRARCFELAETLNVALPECREKSLAITKLEEVMYLGNAALARDPG